MDLLVEFGPVARIGFLAWRCRQHDLSALFGRSVELVPRAGRKPATAESVVQEAEAR